MLKTNQFIHIGNIMICKHLITKEEYNYRFVEDGKVELENKYNIFTVLYEDWCQDFLVIDKWNTLKFKNENKNM